MKIITKQIEGAFQKNAKLPEEKRVPVLKMFNPCGAATWLFSEMDGDQLFGLCDLGMGTPELGYASLSEMMAIKLPFGLKIERDLHFDARGKTLAEFADEAREKGRINA